MEATYLGKYKLVTNDGVLCVHDYKLIQGKKGPALAIRKKVLTKKDFELFEGTGFLLIRKYKDYHYYQQIFSIRLSTLGSVLNTIKKISKKS